MGLSIMKNKGINAKLGNLSNGEFNGVCKDFKDIYKLMDLVQELQNSEQTLQTNGQKVTEEKKEIGDESSTN
jgi:hypothetical protein